MKTTINRLETVRAFFAMLAIIALLAAPLAPVFAETSTDTPAAAPQTIQSNEGDNNNQGDNNGGDNNRDNEHHIKVCARNDGGDYSERDYTVGSDDFKNFLKNHGNDDTIPSFSFGQGEGFNFAGFNWDNDNDGNHGRNFHDNRCKPVPVDVCPNIEGAQATVPQGMVLNDGECFVPTPKSCMVVSDATTLLGTSTQGAALAWVHPLWDNTIASGTAKWIWTTTNVTDPSVSETATFTKYFNVDVAPTGATLMVSADNSYTVSLNGTPLSCDGSGSNNFTSADTCSAPVVAGINTLTFTATNDAYGTTDPHTNPAGLIYQLSIDGSSCSAVPQDACINIDGLQTTVPQGYAANSDRICSPVVVAAPFCRVGSNLLQNASFETPTAPTNSWNIFATVANWAISNDGLEIWNKFNGSGAGLASAGDQNAELDGNSPSNISQTIATVPGATYELRYDFSPRVGRNLADNSVDAQAGGVSVSTTSADGSANSGNLWTTHSATFVATSTATTITFKDLGTPNSFGTLIDNTGVCFVSAAPAPMCNLVEVSGTSTMVTETASAAKILSYLHPAWTAAINSASWIWGQDPVNLADTQINATQHFVKTFTWQGGVGSAVLALAADNSYVVKLNGTQIGADAGEFNYNAAGQDTITGFNGLIVNGTNTLEIAVTNKGIVGSTQTSNPAGLLYKLTITGSDKSCTPTDGGGGEGQPTVTSQMVVVKAADLAANLGDVVASTTKWFFYNDETDAIDNTLGSFVAGPATAPLGVGSAQMSVTGTQRRNIATYQFKDVKLADIKKLNFSTYAQSVGDGSPATGRAPYLNFNIDFYNTDTWQKRLVYVPATNGTVVADTWQTWNAASGTALWTWSGFAANGNKWPDNNTNANRTWNDIVASFPNIQTRSTDSWFGFRVGEPYNNGFTGNVDDFVIAITTGLNTHTKTTDFEPDTVATTVTTNDGGGNGGGGSSGGRSGSHNRNFTNGGGSTGEVLGASTSNLPNGEVLGAVAPVGAPNTGEGGTDTNTTANALTALFVALLGLGLLVAPKRA